MQHLDAKHFGRFALIGAACTLLQFSILLGLAELAHVAKPLANAIGYVVSAATNYTLNRAISFSGTRVAFHHGLVRFALVSGVGLGLNTLIFISLLRAGSPYVFAWAAAVAAVLIWNYMGARYFIFRPLARQSGEP